MLVSSKELLLKAKIQNYAIPQFNINNLETTKFVLEECQKLNSPVILGISESAIKYIGGFDIVYAIVSGLAKELSITVPTVLHLDHGTSVDSCKAAIDAGFTSVMIDASKYELDDNIRITKEVVEYAKEKNISVEAEIGKITTYTENELDDTVFSSASDCFSLVAATNIDSLAPSIGNVHGSFDKKVPLNLSLLEEIKETINLPLVLHGGTGISDEEIKETIRRGICKININTELQVAWAKALREYLIANPTVYDPRKIISSGKEAIYEVVSEKIKLFGSSNKN